MLYSLLSLVLAVNFSVEVDQNSLLKKDTDIVNSPVVVVVTEFSEDSALQFSKDMQNALNTKQPIIPIVISSYGGSIYAFLQMADVIKSVKVPVATICAGKCMSAGAMLLAMGTDGFRFAGPNSTILIHDASSRLQGKLQDLETEVSEVTRLNKLMFTMLAKQCHKSEDFFMNLLDSKGHIDLFLTPEQAKDYGIVNEVKIPTLKIKVNTQVELE